MFLVIRIQGTASSAPETGNKVIVGEVATKKPGWSFQLSGTRQQVSKQPPGSPDGAAQAGRDVEAAKKVPRRPSYSAKPVIRSGAAAPGYSAAPQVRVPEQEHFLFLCSAPVSRTSISSPQQVGTFPLIPFTSNAHWVRSGNE